ncbi:hypothetical protein ACTQ2N_05360 [Ruminococcus sp. LCP21S3_E8]
MSKNWDYSILSHEVKLAGGPEKYAQKLINTGRIEAVGAIALLSTILYATGKAIETYKQNKKKRYYFELIKNSDGYDTYDLTHENMEDKFDNENEENKEEDSL